MAFFAFPARAWKNLPAGKKKQPPFRRLHSVLYIRDAGSRTSAQMAVHYGCLQNSKSRGTDAAKRRNLLMSKTWKQTNQIMPARCRKTYRARTFSEAARRFTFSGVQPAKSCSRCRCYSHFAMRGQNFRIVIPRHEALPLL